ncbi:MAG: hypothetical protein DRJ38_04695 [Thermoprotei archaeon]|nr:MAG: hypothetical protein DRJ38_04695 [Thermoprotei archaeon]
MSEISCLIFDAGDLLYYRRRKSHNILREVVSRIAKRNIKFSEEDLLLFYELRELSYRGIISRKKRIFLFLKHLGISEKHLEKIFNIYDKILQESTIFYKNVPDTLRGLKSKGYRLAVLSDSDYSAKEKMIWFRKADIAELFDAVICSCDIGYCKPEERAYFAVLEKLGAEPEEAIFIGHSVKDLLGARNIGLKTIALRCLIKSREIADVYIKDFKDLLQIA